MGTWERRDRPAPAGGGRGVRAYVSPAAMEQGRGAPATRSRGGWPLVGGGDGAGGWGGVGEDAATVGAPARADGRPWMQMRERAEKTRKTVGQDDQSALAQRLQIRAVAVTRRGYIEGVGDTANGRSRQIWQRDLRHSIQIGNYISIEPQTTHGLWSKERNESCISFALFRNSVAERGTTIEKRRKREGWRQAHPQP